MVRKTAIKNPEPTRPLPETLLDVQGVTKILGIGRTKLFELIREQSLPHIHWGKRTLRFDPRDIATWLENQKQESV